MKLRYDRALSLYTLLLILPCRVSAPEEGPNSLENALSQKTNRHLEYED